MSRATDRTMVDFWFDPVCPWAWMTSRWMLEVARQRDIDITWRIMSLSILNEDRALDERRRAGSRASLEYGRLIAGIATELGADRVGAAYEALGRRIHIEGRGWGDDMIFDEVARELGLSHELVVACRTGAYDDALSASHHDGIQRVGTDVGTPIVSIDGVAFFGPVVSPAPKGEAALRLFDGVRMVAGVEGFFEIKRSRTRGPELG